MTEFTQGICQDGAAILRDGVPMTIEQILEELRGNELALKIADESSVALLQCHLVRLQDGDWLDVYRSDPCDYGSIKEAIEYLELRDLVERHETCEGLVRVIEQEDEQG